MGAPILVQFIRVMRKMRFWSLMFMALSSAALRRLLFGPKRPSWSFMMEMAVSFIRMSSKISKPSPKAIEKLRQAMGHAPKIKSRVTFHTVEVAGVKAEWMEHVEAKDSGCVVLYLHGGAYCFLSSATHRGLTSKFSKLAKAKVLAIDYRLAPEYPFPCALNDAVAAYTWLIDPNGGAIANHNVFIAGDSAGGGLAVSTLLHLRDKGIPLPAAAVLLSPWVDLECSMESWKRNKRFDYLPSPNEEFNCARMYAGSHSLRNPLVSPIHARLHSLPPILIQVGEVEVLFDEAVVLADNCKRDNVPVKLEIYPDMIHVFQGFGSIAPTAHTALTSAAAFIKAHASSAAPKLLLSPEDSPSAESPSTTSTVIKSAL